MPITKWRNLAINQTKAADVVLFNVKFSLHPSHFLVFRYDGRRTQGGIRMDKIAFLVADELMQQSVATIIQTYNEKLTQHSFRIKIEIIDFPRLIDTIPILCLFSSTNDALYTLRSIAPKYKKIHLLLNENFMFNKDACPEELRKKIVCRSIPSAPVNRRCSRSCSTRKNSWSSKKRTASSCP